MASSTSAVPPLYDLPGVAEEIRRQLALAKDAQLASEVGHHDETVLSNIMLTGQESGQVAPPEDLEKGSSGAANTPVFSPVSNFKNGTDHNTSTDAQAAPPASTLDQISAGSDFVSHHNQTPRFEGQILTPDIHLAQLAQLGAAPPSQAEQFSPGREEPETTYIDINDAPVASADASVDAASAPVEAPADAVADTTEALVGPLASEPAASTEPAAPPPDPYDVTGL